MEREPMPTVGLVLAGGRGRRFGGPKAAALLGGVTLAERAARVLACCCDTVLVSVADAAMDPAPGRQKISDRLAGRLGPLAGIDAAFAAVGQARLAVLACDYPAVEPALPVALLERADPGADVVCPVEAGGRLHPLVAVWHPRTASLVREHLRRGDLAVRDLLAVLRVQVLGAAELGGVDLEPMLVNVNRREELQRVSPR